MATKVKVKCPYADRCVDADSGKCSSCLNNEKRSYYRPDYWYPYRYPWYYEPYIYPYYDPWKITYTGTGIYDGSTTVSYYTQA